jgi:hypothetical protein
MSHELRSDVPGKETKKDTEELGRRGEAGEERRDQR